jgi:hypothetical protein
VKLASFTVFGTPIPFGAGVRGRLAEGRWSLLKTTVAAWLCLSLVGLALLVPACRHTVVAPPTPVVPPSSLASISDDPTAYVAEMRLFGKTAFTAPPRNVFDPLEAKRPVYEADPYAWNPPRTFRAWVDKLDAGTLQFGVSIGEAEGMYPSLESATVADIGAGYGNNLPAWKKMMGGRGRLVETEVDPNAARFMAWSASRLGYADRTMVIQNTFENPCLPVGQFDAVLCSQLHSHISIGPYPRSAENDRIFREESKVFLGAIRASLKDDRSVLIVIEGFSRRRDPKQLYYERPEAIANIESNGFTLSSSRQNDHVWCAVFHRTAAPR